MLFDILTLFPAMFEGAFTDSIIKRAADKGLVSIDIHNIRDYSDDVKHQTVDDYPYGGDAGMLMKPEPLAAAIRAAKERLSGKNPTVVYLTPVGRLLNQGTVKELSAKESLILLCGRYKGIDQRVIDNYVDMELSVGDYVLSGGEIPAMAVVDAVTRLIPGVLSNIDSAETDSFHSGLLSHPHYTRPEVFEGIKVPDVLISGHHANIREWQHQKSLEITKERRPDLLNRECRTGFKPPRGDF
ncbi:MAG: tRNA (guanosine(37)-N1)-methyltransferase TrmD [Chitinispirillia bacterium]|nr:tRNA (guanosine(37)-N1)-methyltransferase TrmD [Chitinispirillia bacterium]MCL2241399.1 tRNA (guanosine(37)-N1)-methyltransferase TrmD [Chitinispirillia bacterium]